MTTTTSVYESKPWLARYRDDYNHGEVTVEFASALDMVRAAVERDPDCEIVKYFDGTLTWRELDEVTTALAAGLLANGFQRGDRLAVYLQNVPQFVLAMVATWKAGGVMVSINPMNRERELAYQLTDSGAKVLLCLESLYDSSPARSSPTPTCSWC